jgi:lysophospholipase L1-like esterase
MFEKDKIESIRAFYETRDRWIEIKNYRTLQADIGSVRSIFFGDSITNAWPLAEFFPGKSILNRGIGGDNVYGLYDRLGADVLSYVPKSVFMMIGINGIDEEEKRIVDHIEALAEMMMDKGISVYLSSILPLRSPDKWDRFQYQEKIVSINSRLSVWANSHAAGFLDYHTALKDDTGQLAAECAQPDGTHVTFEAYRRMARIVKPYIV